MQHDISLANFSTMRLGGTAAHLAEVRSVSELLEAYTWATTEQLPVIMIGGGSNIVWQDAGFTGLVLVNKLTGYETLSEDESGTVLRIGAGEIWDEVVARTVSAGLTGVEALSLIPGTAGATPVQNVGAYGQEISRVLVSVEAFDTTTNAVVSLPAADCGFSYRASRFNSTDKGRFFITAIVLHLRRGQPEAPFYPAVATYFAQHDVTDPQPADLRTAVIAIRSAKLPDPAAVANNGSFFGNPIVPAEKISQLQADFPGTEIPHWPAGPDSVKLSAAWLIEQAGFKDFHDPETGMATWPAQPLVLVNEHARSTADLLAFKQKLVTAVEQKFGVTLKQEPELLP